MATLHTSGLTVRVVSQPAAMDVPTGTISGKLCFDEYRSLVSLEHSF